MLRRIGFLLGIIVLATYALAWANPDAIVIPNGDVRIKGSGSGLVFPDGSIQYKATGPVTLSAVCDAIAAGGKPLPAFCLTAATNPSGALTIAAPTLRFSESTVVYATFKKSDDTPASGITVTFSTTRGTLNPGSGAVATDANGTAAINLSAGGTPGTGLVSASATVENKLVTASAPFSVSMPALHLANLQLTNNAGAAISFGSSQGVAVEVRDASGELYTSQPVAVTFSSLFASQGHSTITSPVSTVGGLASTTYTSLSAAGTDTITASLPGSSLSVSLTINPLNAGAISFVSAAPTSLGLKGMGGLGLQETSKVTFKVVDTAGVPKSNQLVAFALNTTVGGLSLSVNSGSTDANGLVSTIVQSGTVATPVRVTASTIVGGSILSTQSDQLVVSTGVPSQDSFSLSRSNQNPEAWDIDGATTVITARLSDHFHNPVPDGTAVSFTTSGGSVEPSCLTTRGACSVTWTSQNPRPLSVPGATRGGRAVVLAYAIGEESFLDLNGNGLADPGEFTDTTEAFRDDNENGMRDASELFIDFNGDGMFNFPDGSYNGILQGPAFSGAPRSKMIFANTVIVMSSSQASVTSQPPQIFTPGGFSISVTDINGNIMPSGTTISVTAPFGILSGLTSFTVTQNAGFGVTLPMLIAAGATPTLQSGFLTVTVRSPSGFVTTSLVPISGSF